MKGIIVFLVLLCMITPTNQNDCETCLFVMSGYEMFPAVFPTLTGKKLEDFTCSEAKRHRKSEKLCHKLIKEVTQSKTLAKKLKEDYNKETIVYDFCKSELSEKYCP
ncbi:hypothetical protein Y032_0101g3401 [Ancylostoma ceylanicum]|uniref:Saposin B-type domain-containing protein n=1 Tax=Ancylostoma ceylanicum TaxID=53326 RepID=A0A016THV4_9BILA|nr:hypothetical protein Y032_0101g3401 [Ancylostoma ceylanicum]